MGDTADFESQETITFDEFRAWMTGLIQGKRGALPDIEDWKMIKKMMDKVVPEKEFINIPQPIDPGIAPQPPFYPSAPPYVPWASPTTDKWTISDSTDNIPSFTTGSGDWYIGTYAVSSSPELSMDDLLKAAEDIENYNKETEK